MTVLEKYIKHLLLFKQGNPKYSKVMLVILKEYSKTSFNKHKLTFTLSKQNKETIAFETGLSVSRVNHIISEFIKLGLIDRINNGTYCLNENYFCCNSFNQITEIKAQYDYIKKAVYVEFC